MSIGTTRQTGRSPTRGSPGGLSGRCPCCGWAPWAAGDAILKRGAVTVHYEPLEVRWRGKYVQLSRTEALIFERFMRRGRATFEMLDKWLEEIGARRATRSLVILHIRRKFEAVGAHDPFERLANEGYRLQLHPDENGSRHVMIGMRDQPAHAAP